MAWPKVTFHAGPFLGMRYISRPEDWDHHYLYQAVDAFPTPDGMYAIRTGTTGIAPTGASASATVQGGTVFRTSDGTTREILAINGELWRRTANDFTKDVSTTNLTSATVSVNTTGRIYFTTFNDQLVVSDGTHTPFTWDGTVSAGLTKLTNAPVAFGPPTVYYAKLFFVKNTERDTIVWSEENDATTGYEAGGFNNAWSLRQSGAGALNRILGRNEALYYWRAGSIGTIRGAVTSDFTASGVHDDISREVGTTAPESVIDYDGYLWFVDGIGRPFRFAPGGSLEPIWQNVAALFPGGMMDTLSGLAGERALSLTAADIALTLTAPLPLHRAVVFAWTPSGVSTYSALYAFDVSTGRALCKLNTIGNLQSVHHVSGGITLTPSDYPCMTVAGLNSTTLFVITAGDPGISFTNVTPVFVLGPFVAPAGQILQASRFRAQFVIGPASATKTLSTVASVVDTGQWGATGSALPGTILLSAAISAPQTRIATWGLNRRSRWLQFRLSAEQANGVVPQLVGVDLDAYLLPLSPKVTT